MYIANIDNSNNKYYECGRIIGKYLVKHGLPLLSVNDKGKMMFAKTEKLQKVMNTMPFYLKIFKKGRCY